MTARAKSEIQQLRKIAESAWWIRKLLRFWASRGITSPAELINAAEELDKVLDPMVEMMNDGA